jgi:hypothetical protein
MTRMEPWAIGRQAVEALVTRAWREKTREAIEAALQAIREWEAKHPKQGPLIAFRSVLDRYRKS